MKNAWIAIAAPLALAACATAGPAATAGNGTAAAAKGTQYCWKSRLATEGEQLGCNWAASAAEACRSTEYKYVRRSAVASGPTNSRLCDNGEWLVLVTTK